MKTVEIVKAHNGWHVTRRYCGQNKGTEFFCTTAKDLDKAKSEKQRKAKITEAYQKAEDAKNAYVKEWVGE
jgi:hypothetical protein